MKIFFVFSGEHDTLPEAEAVAVLEAVNAKFRILDSLEQVLIVQTNRLNEICDRIALARTICEFYGICNADADADAEEILNTIKELKFDFSGSFAVRIKRIKTHFESLDTLDFEKKIGEIVNKKTGMQVNLTNPANVIYGVLSEKFILGKILHELDRSQYEKRRPHYRPYFYPGAMLPKYCRAIVNLARIKKGDRFIDPFCGTGGFLIEAAMIGAKVYGCDIEHASIKGSKMNLEHYGIKNYRLEVCDARKLKEKYFEYFDGLAADLPYGISSSTKGIKLEALYEESVESFYEILKPRKYATIVSPAQLPSEEIAENNGFKVVEAHTQRIHRSLTRKILVARKK